MHFLHCVLLQYCVAALDEKTREQIKTTFDLMNEIFVLESMASQVKTNSLSVINVPEDRFFYMENNDVWTMALAIPDTEQGENTARGMISETHHSYHKHGFMRACNLLQHSIWTVFFSNDSEQVKVAVLYATKNHNQIELVNTVSIWGGLFRDSRLIYQTRPSHQCPGSRPKKINMSPKASLFVFEKLKLTWQVRRGDILVITNIGQSQSFEEVIQLAIESVEVNILPVSQIVSTLRAYYNMDENKVFAAVRMT